MDLLEYYHSTGQCPDRYYYQLNGKDAAANYQEIKRRRAEDTRKLLEDRHLEQLIEKQVQERLDAAVEKALEEILKGFGK